MISDLYYVQTMISDLDYVQTMISDLDYVQNMISEAYSNFVHILLLKYTVSPCMQIFGLGPHCQGVN